MPLSRRPSRPDSAGARTGLSTGPSDLSTACWWWPTFLQNPRRNLRVPVDREHWFRLIVNIQSSWSWTPIPGDREHRFRWSWARFGASQRVRAADSLQPGV